MCATQKMLELYGYKNTVIAKYIPLKLLGRIAKLIYLSVLSDLKRGRRTVVPQEPQPS